MTKLVSKKKLQICNGEFVDKKGNIVNINGEVLNAFNRLEREYQKHLHSKLWDTTAILVPEFEFDSEHEDDISIHVDTPLIDATVAETMALMKELDAVENAKLFAEKLKEYSKLIKWCDSKKVKVWKTEYSPLCTRIDAKYLGNILDYTGQDIVDKIKEIME